MRRHDFIVVGSGFFGATVAERLASQSNKVTVLEKRDHIGGNSWSQTDKETGIEVHKYGSHIFHTSNATVWRYINQFAEFNNYRHSVWTEWHGKTYSMPISLGTINAFYGLNLRPTEVSAFLEREREKERYDHPANLEEQAIALVGRPLYEAFVRGYTIKQWGKDPKNLPSEIIQRLPVRENYNTSYFQDCYEGIPANGYGSLFGRMLDHPNIAVHLGTNWFDVRAEIQGKLPVVYTGPIDAFFDYKHGPLEWRSVRFEREVHPVPDFQGTSVMNYADIGVPWTRIHEFRHYHPERVYGSATVIYREYSGANKTGEDPYYPVSTPESVDCLAKYRQDAARLESTWFGGRLGTYRYIDMDDAVLEALAWAERWTARL